MNAEHEKDLHTFFLFKEVQFWDIGSALFNPQTREYLFAQLNIKLRKLFGGVDNTPHVLVFLDSRGFLMTSLATKNSHIILCRKANTLPGNVVRQHYSCEYAQDRCVEIQTHHNIRDMPVIIVDDILATGGTARAAANLIQQVGGKIVGFLFIGCIENLKRDTALPAPYEYVLPL